MEKEEEVEEEEKEEEMEEEKEKKKGKAEVEEEEGVRSDRKRQISGLAEEKEFDGLPVQCRETFKYNLYH